MPYPRVFLLAALFPLLSTTAARAQNYEFTTFVGSANEPGSTNGVGTAARIAVQVGIAADSTGNLYLADAGNRLIRKITPAGLVTTVAGLANVSGSTDGPIAAARFTLPWGIAVDPAGNIYITENNLHTLRKIGTDGMVSTIAGQSGVAGSVDGKGNAARFNMPTSVATDSEGNLFVTDSNNSTIRKVTPDGTVTTFAGVSGITGSTNGPVATALFNHPAGIIVDSSNNLFVADSDNQLIRKITSGGIVSTIAGAANLVGTVDGPGAAARFGSPLAIAVDPAGNLFVAEYANSVIRKITPAGIVNTIGGTPGLIGSADGVGSAARFNKPYGITVDRTGLVYVSDTFNYTIRKGQIVPAPQIVASPTSLSVTPNSTVALSVSATGNALTYQWKRNGLPVVGATSATYVIPGQSDGANVYVVDVTNGGGTVTSTAATVTVAESSNPGRISNLAIRSQAGTDAQTLIVGTFVGGAGTVGTKPLLLRGVGPTLATFNVTGVLADPVLNLFNNSGKIAENDDWAGAFDFSSVGAFNFTGGAPKDAALFSPTTASGGYSIQIAGKNGTTGTALAEIYDATPAGSFTPTTPRLTNVSARTQVGTGGDILIAGFTIGGATAKTVLIRAAGPALVDFGVVGILANPKLELFNGPTLLYSNDDWAGDTALSSAGGSVGAFAFTNPASKDAAIIVTLAPGGYTAQVSGVGATTGVALIEVYEIP